MPLALVVTDLKSTRLGLPSRVGQSLAGRTVLEHTLARVARVPQIDQIVLIHPAGQDPMGLMNQQSVSKPVACVADPDLLDDSYRPMRTAARKWSLSSWRGGLGGATCYDELLPANPLLAAMTQFKADSALLVGGDWPLVDPVWCERVLELHLANPEAMSVTFTQAPPGLAGIAMSRNILQQLSDNAGSTIGQMLSYDPFKPQADPIGRDVCVQIPGEVRSLAGRFIYDTPRSVAMIDAVADRLGEKSALADASAVAGAAGPLINDPGCGFAPLPQQIVMELTPQRSVSGPIVPQHYHKFNRAPMPLELATLILEQVRVAGDVAVTLGGLGDAMLHPQWPAIVATAHRAGAMGIAVETDLLADRLTVERLLEFPIDVVSVRLNADTAATYLKTMGSDQFAKVIENLQWLLNERNRRGRGSSLDKRFHPAVPWLVPRMIKTAETLPDMETFFDRWVHFMGQAVIEAATPGRGPDGRVLMPPLSPVDMAPPRRIPCRQLSRRMTILSDGTVALCDQDWMGSAKIGNAKTTPLTEIWQAMQEARTAHAAGKWDQMAMCKGCREWHRV